MNETLYYHTSEHGRRIFVHSHEADNPRGFVYLFFNPLLDEKKMAQSFMASAARHLSARGDHVVRFDYFATGDSYGALHEFDLADTEVDALSLYNHVRQLYPGFETRVLGVRAGGDLALRLAHREQSIRRIYLLEPLVRGSRYLLEQRSKRTMSLRLNGLDEKGARLQIACRWFEDFQGYPWSEEVVAWIARFDSAALPVRGKELIILKFDVAGSKRPMREFARRMEANNAVVWQSVACRGFWKSLEPLDTASLTTLCHALDEGPFSHDCSSIPRPS